MRTFGLVFLLAAGTVACGDLDTIDRVHDLRILAMQADPPEQVISMDAPAPGPVHVTGLVADPRGAGRSVHYRFSTCAKPDKDLHRCDPGMSAYAVLAEGDVAATELGAEPTMTFTPSAALLQATLAEDDYHGFGGLPVTVQLEITAGSERVVATKRVVFSAAGPDGGPPPNTNPVLQGARLGGIDWAPGTTPTLGKADGGTPALPVFDAALQEPYTRQTFEGETLEFREAWQFDFFCTRGSFDVTQTGGANFLTGQSGDLSDNWSPKDEDADGVTTFWIVVSDGRGGTSWISRQANFHR